MESKLKELIEARIEVNNVTIRPFDGFLFLCGGAIEGNPHALASARDYAMRRADANGKIAGHRIVVAETMTVLLQGDDFSDLLEFEEHIAALSACVLIFVESPGSIAELGSFSVMPHLSGKLLVVLEQAMESALKPSFIFLGPVASLKRKRRESVQIFPIFADGTAKAERNKLDECWEFIEESVLESVKRPIPEAPFDPKLLPHRMILAAALMNLGVAIKIGELQDVLSLFNVSVSPKDIRRIVRTLEQFELARQVTYGNEKFLFTLFDHPVVTFRAPAGSASPFDSVRFKADVLSAIEVAEPRRFKAVRSFRRSGDR